MAGLLVGLLVGGPFSLAGSPAGAAAPTQPVEEQNKDGSGFIRVHEQGTANVTVQGTASVNVANPNLPVSVSNTNLPVNVTNATLPVNLTNSSVPVTGTVGLASAANTVKIDSNNNTVRLGNTESSPALVRDVDTLTPFQTEALVLIPGGQCSVFSNVYAPPSGKVLVVDFVAASGEAPAGERVRATLYAQLDATIARFQIPMQPQGTFGANDEYAGSQAMRAYAAQTTNVGLNVQRSNCSAGSAASVLVQIAGRLVGAP